MHKLEKALGEWVVRKRRWIAVLSIAALVTTAYGVRFLTFDNDTRVYFSKENPQLVALEMLEKIYSRDNTLLFAIVPEGGDVFTRETLSAVEKLTGAAWRIPYSTRVDSITNFQSTLAEEDELVVEDLVQNAANLTDEELRRIRETALSEPLLINQLVSPTGHAAGVNVMLALPGESLEEVPEAAAFGRQLARDIEAEFPGVDIRLAGTVMLDNAFGEVSQDDTRTLVPLMIGALAFIIYFALRSIAGLVVTLMVVLASMLTALGLAGWFGIVLNSTSVNAPTMILTLAVADSIHILSSAFLLLGRGMGRHEAIAESLRVNLQPVLLTSLTTAIGFLSMNFSDAPPFRDLGNIVAMGIMAALVYSVFSLPAFLSFVPLQAGKKSHSRLDRFMGLQRLSEFVVRRQRLVLWSTVALVALVSTGVSKITLDDDFIKYFDERYEVRRDLDYVEANLGGLHRIEYSLDSGEPGAINDPVYLGKVEEFAKWYRSQPGVAHVSAVTDIMKRLNKNMHADDPAYYGLPDSRSLAAQYLLLYEMSLPFGLNLNRQINVDESATRLTVSLSGVTSTGLREIDNRARKWLTEHAPKSMHAYGSGTSLMFSYISMRNIRSMLGASFLALFTISILLIAAFRSLRFGLLSLAPNLAPALMGLGFWGFAVGQVGLVVSVIGAMTMGIVVDDTIHFMSKYLRARREHGMSQADAVRYAFGTVGAAMLISSAALVAGFSVLAFSGFAINSDMGMISAITITFALMLDFLLLPSLLLWADRPENKTQPFPEREV